MFEWNTNLSEPDRIRQNIANLTEVRQGDIPYDRGTGAFAEWIDKSFGNYSAEMMSDLTTMLNTKEPRVKSNVELDNDHKLKIVLESEDDDE